MYLSIVIPTRNRSHFLAQCLASLSREIGPASDIEIIVVDDASVGIERTKNMALCKEAGCMFLPLEKRMGQAFARNCGINSSEGAWIAFLDDDVRVERGWLGRVRAVLADIPGQIIGIEGRVVPEGDGLWDREVQNDSGGQYLTCHILYRAEVLKKIGGFDERFKDPVFCEDHELASRALRWGPVKFEQSLVVTHAARHVPLQGYLLGSFRRIYSQLTSEWYFYAKQKDMYHLFRYCPTFFGTYQAILLKHTMTTLRRRMPSRVIRHPIQFGCLLASCLLEQATAWALTPYFAWRFCSSPLNFFSDAVDTLRTGRFWGVATAIPPREFKVRYSLYRGILFSVSRKPAYSSLPFLRHYIRTRPDGLPGRCFLRIDDVFLDQDDSVLAMCELFRRKRVPYLAAVAGSHMAEERHADSLAMIRSSGGQIGIHGFQHAGKFGPFNSEVLQLPFPRLSTMLDRTLARFPGELRPFVFVPPFNAINRDQILFLGSYFRVVCGGPETARFTDGTFGPVALANGPWYVPSFYPFYQSADGILRSLAAEESGIKGCNVCFTVHMPDEAKDGFGHFSQLLDRLGPSLEPWTLFTHDRL